MSKTIWIVISTVNALSTISHCIKGEAYWASFAAFVFGMGVMRLSWFDVIQKELEP